MEYLVLDKDGNDITSQVKVMRKDNDDWKYCRQMANEWLERADKFHEKEIMDKMKLISNTKMDDFGPEFDSERGALWTKRIDEIRAEIKQKELEWEEMIKIAGDWEDKEYAARLNPVINFISVISENPLISKHNLKEGFKWYVTEMGVPNLATYI